MIRRRWFQFSVRGCLIGVTIAGAIGGLLSERLRTAASQRRAVEAIRARGGSVVYDFECHPDGGYWMHPRPRGPERLRNLLGLDYFNSVVEAELYESDRDIDILAHFPQLRTLCLYGDGFTDTAVERICKLRQLRGIELYYTAISADGEQRLRLLLPECEVFRRDGDL